MADLALRPLRGIAADRDRRVDQEIEPIGNLFDLRTALGIDGALVFLAVEYPSRRIGETRERRSRRGFAEKVRPVGEEILAAGFRRNVSIANVSAARCGQALGVAGGRKNPVEIYIRKRRNQVSDALRSDAQPVDLLKAA